MKQTKDHSVVSRESRLEYDEDDTMQFRPQVIRHISLVALTIELKAQRIFDPIVRTSPYLGGYPVDQGLMNDSRESSSAFRSATVQPGR